MKAIVDHPSLRSLCLALSLEIQQLHLDSLLSCGLKLFICISKALTYLQIPTQDGEYFGMLSPNRAQAAFERYR